jgi:hypothetical protein
MDFFNTGNPECFEGVDAGGGSEREEESLEGKRMGEMGAVEETEGVEGGGRRGT